MRSGSASHGVNGVRPCLATGLRRLGLISCGDALELHGVGSLSTGLGCNVSMAEAEASAVRWFERVLERAAVEE
jgi:hypothetical protein